MQSKTIVNLLAAIRNMIQVHYLNDFTVQESFNDIQKMIQESIDKISSQEQISSQDTKQLLVENLGDLATEEYLYNQIIEVYENQKSI